MARRHYSKRRRTPIKNTKTYKRGMWQVALVSLLAISIGLRTKMVRDVVATINNVVPGGEV